MARKINFFYFIPIIGDENQITFGVYLIYSSTSILHANGNVNNIIISCVNEYNNTKVYKIYIHIENNSEWSNINRLKQRKYLFFYMHPLKTRHRDDIPLFLPLIWICLDF